MTIDERNYRIALDAWLGCTLLLAAVLMALLLPIIERGLGYQPHDSYELRIDGPAVAPSAPGVHPPAAGADRGAAGPRLPPVSPAAPIP